MSGATWILTCVGLGGLAGALLFFAAEFGRVRDVIGGAFLAVLVAVLLALSLALTGCATPQLGDHGYNPKDGTILIPIPDWALSDVMQLDNPNH